MDYKYEVVTTSSDLPVKIIYHDSDDTDYVPRHWHECIEISYVLSGKIDDIYIEGAHYVSEQGDIVLINSNHIHSVSVHTGKDQRAMTLLIPVEFITSNYPQTGRLAFICLSAEEQDEGRKDRFAELRALFNRMLEAHLNMDQDPLANIQIKALSYQLIYLLLKYFKAETNSPAHIKSNKYLDRLTQITDYIKQHYDQNVTIHEMAKAFGFSSEYFSRFFQRHIGMTVLNYINAVRLEKSYRDLMNTDLAITHIALKHGFPNEKSFCRVFKAAYQLTPNEYRKKYKG
ncbi:AraC family transcriptional regulator [Paenibacillus pinistramenti]|uniref:AraC family transcriptional regulator n=1 Tax=Paenibacillus pinistramenti TaxID=1768003 RepID=UPI001107B2DE|nr:AraC family transcriptional regulator [Paenibacillus pinistramenti]